MGLRQSAQADLRDYREGYPGKADDPTLKQNKCFYFGESPCKPDNMMIDDIHKRWFGNYDLLESAHGYIQWLFPIRESGLNSLAQELQLHEAAAIAADPVAQGRVIKSYELMLDFYGFRLVSSVTGEVARAEDYEKQFENLNFSSHNYLRITRILKCLGEVGLERLKAPWLRLLVDEVFVHKTLPRCASSLTSYWIPTLRNDAERETLKAAVKPYVREEPEDCDEAESPITATGMGHKMNRQANRLPGQMKMLEIEDATGLADDVDNVPSWITDIADKVSIAACRSLVVALRTEAHDNDISLLVRETDGKIRVANRNDALDGDCPADVLIDGSAPVQGEGMRVRDIIEKHGHALLFPKAPQDREGAIAVLFSVLLQYGLSLADASAIVVRQHGLSPISSTRLAVQLAAMLTPDDVALFAEEEDSSDEETMNYGTEY